MQTMKQYVMSIVRNAIGDDLERAKSGFRGLSDKDMDAEYGASGKTRRQILEEYQIGRDRMIAALAWVESRPE